MLDSGGRSKGMISFVKVGTARDESESARMKKMRTGLPAGKQIKKFTSTHANVLHTEQRSRRTFSHMRARTQVVFMIQDTSPKRSTVRATYLTNATMQIRNSHTAPVHIVSVSTSRADIEDHSGNHF